MKLGWNLDTGVERRITSWKSQDDPSIGDTYFSLNYHGIPDVFLWNKQQRVFRTGSWNGERFGGVPILNTIAPLNDTIVADKHQVYYLPSSLNQSSLSRLIVNWTGVIERYAWIESSQSWSKIWSAPDGDCDHYGVCGPFGICDSNSFPVCQCIQGFNVKNQGQWDLRNFSDGCTRKTELECGKDKFLHKTNVQLPDATKVFVDKNMTLLECRNMCQMNCSCTAYANAEITNGGTGCVMWTDNLIDMRQFSANGQDLYVKLAASDFNFFSDDSGTGSPGGSDKKNNAGMIVGIAVTVAIVILGVIIFILWKKRKLHSILRWNKKQDGNSERGQKTLLPEVIIHSINREHADERNMDDLELPLFDFNTITQATNYFSLANKLGEGGFGSVYMGRLVDGQEIAVKRLSTSSGQGNEEFKNEVRSIAKLQHRNLVRLFGCCIEKEEKMLIYEYMENKSLDSILFDTEKSSILDWPMRFNIICGIAKGLLYLHHDSRFRIIHRDLKASNILLDREMNPKISDFGIARIFDSDQTQANTRRVVGTYGYMSPEYAMGGFFSVKSDVFSFGVLVLEIISGKKNRGFYSNDDINLLGHAWRLWKDGSALELIDPSFGDSYSKSEVVRCIHVGLICVQERAEDRPTMSTVALMLSSETSSLPEPKHPGFVLGRSSEETDSSSAKSHTINQVTVTRLDGRSNNKEKSKQFSKNSVHVACNRIWFTNSSRSIQEPIAKLLDSGNLVLMDGKNNDSFSYIWQSFDYPTDTMLPGMKLGWDKTSGMNRYLTSWKSANDPSPGSFTYSFDHKEFPELVIRQRMNITFRSGIWNGIRFNSDDWTSFTGITAFRPQLLVTNNEVVYWDEPGDRLSRFVLKDDGLLERYIWDNKVVQWIEMYEARKDFCDNYGACGSNGVCNINDVPVYCDCLKGFKPKSQEEWDSFNRSSGCIRRTPLNCTQGDRFQKLSRVKLPMLLQFWTNNGMSLGECEVECLKNCSCTAYANSAINEGPHGCLLWFGNLIDIRLLISKEDVQLDLYVRMKEVG
ncbi:S-locus glycoprotein domain [Sesbania bispinosa]|nr:S-locus glycoprotein domain [Sesbania bispinosa]